MKKNIYKYMAYGVVAIAGAALATSCEDFEQTNTDPNSVTQENVKPTYLMSTTFVRSSMGCDLWQRMINIGTDIYAQYFANECKYTPNQCVPNDEYSIQYWNNTWTWIANLNKAMELCTPEQENLKQVCRIWKVWIYSRLTDFFGDVPYTQACNKNYTEPEYDAQKDIYYDMLKELDEATKALDMNATNLYTESDVLCHGDWAKWRALGNTLRLRLALRLTEVDPAKAKAEAEAAAAAPGGFLYDDVTVWKQRNYYTTDVSYNLFYPYGHYWNSGHMVMSTSMQKILTNLGGVPVEMEDWWQKEYVPQYADPRALIYFNVTSEASGASFQRHREKDPVTGKPVWVIDVNYRGRWDGVKPGLTEAVGNELDNMSLNHARIGAWFFMKDPTPLKDVAPSTGDLDEAREQVLVYGNESYFLLAEAALRGYNVGGDANSFYESGIRASMKRYAPLITDAQINAYLKSTMKNDLGTSVPLSDSEGADLSGNRNSKLMKVITQKYIAGFPENSFEAWNDYRRLGMPALDPFEMPQPGFVMEAKAMDYRGSLRRFIYPADEQTLNANSYAKAVQAIGGDKTTTRMWWDARTEIVK